MNPKAFDYLCTNCARAFGAEFPEESRIPYYYSTCDACDRKRSVCSVRDFDFPNHKLVKD